MFTSTRMLQHRAPPLIRGSVVPLAGSVAFGLALFALALGLRLAMLDADVTHDEDQWMARAGNFALAVRQGSFARTYQIGHPGVVTMELAILGQGPEGAARFAEGAGQPGLVSAVPGYFGGLLDARRPFVLVTAALLAATSLLAWRLLGAGPAVLGGLLLALDPFILGHSRIVQMDGLLSGLMALAALCGLVRWAAGGGRTWLLAGGALSGLAFLTKAPAVYLAIFVPLLALVLGRARGPRTLAADLALWGAAGLATALALWPALWVDAAGVAARMIAFTGETGGRPHTQGNFFLGRQVADPGPLFYPLSVMLRLTPAALLGLLALAVVPRWAPARLSPAQRSVVLALAAYVLGFGLLVTLAQKKFDRYALPVFPIVDLLAGVGLWAALSAARKVAVGGLRQVLLPLAGAALATVMAWPVVSVAPHYLTYYNPLFGGGAAAARMIVVGYGEGLVDAARWLNLRPDAERLTVAADSHDVLQAAFVGQALPLGDRLPESVAYVVVYHYQAQVRPSPRVLVPLRGRAPDEVIRLNGIEYARIYRVTPADRRS